MPKCFNCDEVFPDYMALALHITSAKKGHRKGKRWAAKYLMLNKISIDKKRNNNRTPLTEKDRENKRNSKLELSGQTQTLLTYCPKCKKSYKQAVPVEYAMSPTAWRNTKGILIMACPNCQK